MTENGIAMEAVDALSEAQAALDNAQFTRAVELALQFLDPHADCSSQKRALRLLARSALRATAATIEDSQSALDGLFQTNLPHSAKRYIAACLLRALKANPDLFTEPAFRNRSFNLFDNVLQDIYKEQKITPRSQTHEKEAALTAYVEGISQEISEAFRPAERVAAYDWNTLVPLKASIQRLITHRGNFLRHFIPVDLLGIELEQMFSAVHDYLDATGETSLHEFQRAKASVLSYEQHAHLTGTIFAKELCTRLSTAMAAVCHGKFDESGAGKPATVLIKSSDKKYPFHVAERTINLGLILENTGPGFAQDLECSIQLGSEAEAQKSTIFIGNLNIGQIAIEFATTIKEPVASLMVLVTCGWRNFDGTTGTDNTIVELFGQLAGVDWESLQYQEPYKLEPVSTEETLVGRAEVLSQLVAKTSGPMVGSACLIGQKRVGKTSIAKTLKSRLAQPAGTGAILLFIEAGEYVHPEASRTIEQLGTKICKQIAFADTRFANVQRPTFDGALSPLTDFVDEIFHIVPDTRVVIILDEFDTVPVDLYRRGPTGEAFFATIRSLSQKGRIGFVLVGGERMRYLTDCQGQALNKFQIIKVDYFDRSRYWTDYEELITRPTKYCLQFSDSALQYIYAMSAGNPYYTILICRTLFNLMVSRRDSHVTRREAEEAVSQTIRDASTTSFQHFWDDGIVATGAEMEDVSMRRRYVLLSLADVLRTKKDAAIQDICDAAKQYSMEPRAVENELSEFVQREVLTSSERLVDCKVPLFREWLRTVGPRQISTTYTEAEAVRILRISEEESDVRAIEIAALVARWPQYKGRTISSEDVRAWLEQFGRKSDQRLMFRILQKLRIFSEDEVRSSMKAAHGTVTRGIVNRVAHKQVKRWQSVLVGYLDGPAKSGAYFAKIYADENEMFSDNVVEKSQLKMALTKREDVEAVVFVDDFVGTGESACRYLDAIAAECLQLLQQRNVRVFLMAVAGTEDGIRKTQEHLGLIGLDAVIHVGTRFGPEDMCFGPESVVFPDANERSRAQDVAEQVGRKLCRRDPLGYGGSQAAVVFSHNCPNNSLPILWEKRDDWTPLFRRD